MIIDILLLIALGYAIGWCVKHPDKVKTIVNTVKTEKPGKDSEDPESK